MSEGSQKGRGGLKRRDFLSAAAIPLAAAIAPVGLAAASAPVLRRRQERIRVGLIGAGANVQRVQIPAFRAIPECEIIAVANTSLASSQRVADAFDIPRAYANWRELLDDEDVDAVLIGTWPYVHHTLTLAALESGKHVLCQARMAATAQEAREMLAASLQYPGLTCQLVPTSTSYSVDNVLKRLIGDGFLGEVLSVEVQRLQRGVADFEGELDWRRDREFSGFNILNIGSTYESMMRWLGRGSRVMAMTKIHVPYRRNGSGDLTSVTIPDHVDVLYELANGAQVHMRFSETTGLSSGSQTWIYGTDGTIHVNGEGVFAARRGDTELSEVPNPREGQAYSRVEEEFINSIRGLERVTMVPFESGVHYMEWTEAVHQSAQSGQAVYLPLS